MTQRDYHPRKFLRFVDHPFLHQYCKSVGFDFSEIEKETLDDKVERFLKIVEAQHEDVRNTLDRDFREINDLATESGWELVIEMAELTAFALPDEVDKLEGFYNRVFWVWLKDVHLFNKAFAWHKINPFSRWRELKGLKRTTVKETLGKGDELADALRKLFHEEERRGQRCGTESYEAADRVCYAVYSEDYPTNAIEFADEKGKRFKRVPQRPVFEIYFLFFPKEGKLKVKAKGGRDRIRKLQNIFRKTVLGEQMEVSDDEERVFDLDPLRSRDFVFPTDPRDGVEYVHVRSLTFKDKHTNHLITIEADWRDSSGSTVYDVLKNTRIPLDNCHVNAAVLHIKFPGKGNQGSVTVCLDWPNRCNLGDAPYHLKAKDYLKNWKIDTNDIL